MSGGSGGGQTYQTTNSNSSSGPPTEIAWALNDIAGRRMGDFQANPNAPAYYPGQTVADWSTATQSGLTNLYNRGAQGSQLQQGGQGLAGATLGGQYLDLANNPYFQGAIKYSQQPVIDAFNSQVLPGINSTFSGAGRTSSGAHQAVVGQAADSLTRNLAGAATQAGAGAYDAERSRQMQTMGLLPSFQAADYQDLQAQLQSGGAIDAKRQQYIDADIAKYNYNQNAQGDYLTRVAQQLQSIYPGGTSTGTTQTVGQMPSQGGMGTGGWLGAGMGLAGLGLQAAGPMGFGLIGGGAGAGAAGVASSLAPLMMLSDRRMKTDIKKLGKDPLTGLDMYAYRYKGDPKSYPKVVGPMAQDIEKRGGPVREIGGHKVIGGLI
jgi:hypothetical protein